MVAEQIEISLLERVDQLGQFIGKTPLFPINRVFNKVGVRIFAKLEWQQLGGSVKARPAFNIVKQAILRGDLDGNKRLLDATSGNTGIAYAHVCAALGIPLTICMPENASIERKRILESLGTEIIYTSRFDATDGSQAKAKALAKAYPNRYYYADQYVNPDNWKAHYYTTSEEILAQTQGEITHFVAGLGTTGTFVGTTRGLQELKPTVHFTALHPETALHGLEGWKHLETAKVPRIYDDSMAHQNLEVSTSAAYDMIKKVAAKEGLLLSPSAAANLVGAIKVANQIKSGTIVTIFPDNADKYGEVLKYLFK